MVGSLNIDNKIECIVSDMRDGYKLELIIEGLDKIRWVNRFKVKKFDKLWFLSLIKYILVIGIKEFKVE